MPIKEWHGSGIGGITAVSTVLRGITVGMGLILQYYRGIEAKILGIPVGMGTSPAVLPRL